MVVVAALMLMSSSLSCCCVAQETISPQTFQQGIEDGSYDLVIDVRTGEEWNAGWIPTAVHVPSDSLDEINQILTIGMEVSSSSFSCDDHCATIVVYCRSGARAKLAIQTLINDLGYTGTIYNGLGINQWTGAGYELVDDDSIPPTYPPPMMCTKTDICACVNDPDFRKKKKDCAAHLKRKKGKKCHSGAKKWKWKQGI